MERYLPGAILALCGLAVYAIGCVLLVVQRRKRDQDKPDKALFVYAVGLMILGFLALGAGLLALELAQYHTANG